jgi:hypothetical protein
VERVLYTPVSAYNDGKEFGVWGKGGDKIPLLNGSFTRCFPNRLDNAKGFDSVPGRMAFDEPCDIA